MEIGTAITEQGTDNFVKMVAPNDPEAAKNDGKREKDRKSRRNCRNSRKPTRTTIVLMGDDGVDPPEDKSKFASYFADLRVGEVAK